MEFGVLGPLRVVGDDGPVDIRAPKQRALLAMLLLSHRDDAVPADRLVDALWGEDPPATAGKALQVYVSQLRRALGPGNPIVTRGAGYAADVGPGQLDLERFETLVAQARRARAGGDLDEAAEELREAVSLFRGAPLADAPLLGPAAMEADRLAGLRLDALEEAMDADLARGRHAAIAGELEALALEHPYRERLHAQLVLALYRSGRQADALEGVAEALAQGDEVRAARARGNLGNLLLYELDYERAIRHYEEVRAYWVRSGNTRGLSLIMQNLGIAHEGSGNHAVAVELLDESIEIARRARDPAHLSSALRTQARILLADADPAPALALLREGLTLSLELSDRPGMVETLETMAGIAHRDGDSATGARLIGAAAGTRAAAGAIRQPDEELWVAGLEAELRDALGTDAYAAAFAERGRLTLVEATGLAERV